MGETKRLLKNTGIIAIGGMSTKVVQFILLPLYTAALTTEEYGVIDYLTTIALFCVPIVSLLMDEAMFRFLIDCKLEGDVKKTVSASCAAMALGSAVYCMGSLLYWLLFSDLNVIWVSMLVISSVALQMTSALLRGFGETVAYAILNFFSSFLKILLTVLFILIFRWGVIGMLSASITANLFASLYYFVKKRVWRYVSIDDIDKSLVVSLIGYSLPLIPNKVSWTIMNLADRILIMNMLGAGPAGIYAVAYKFPGVTDTLYGFFYQSWKESSARILASDEDAVTFYNSVYRSLHRIMLGMILVLASFMPLLYHFLVNDAYNEGLKYVPILLLATYFSNISGYYGGIFTGYKDTRIMGTSTVVSALLCVALCVILIPYFGLYGTSIATLVSMFLVNEFRRIKVQKYVQISLERSEIFASIGITLLVLAGYYLFIYTNILACIVCAILVACIFSFYSNRLEIMRLFAYAKGRSIKDGN